MVAYDADIRDDELTILPIRPISAYEYKHEGRGYECYLGVEALLEDWWFEFCTKLDSKRGHLRHKTLANFINTRQSRKEQRSWLHQMMGREPAPLASENQRMYELPYLGDWIKIRKLNQKILNRSQVTFLRKQFDIQKETLARARATAMITVRDIARFTELQDQVDRSFAGMALDPDLSPLDPMNQRRFKLYLQWHSKILTKKGEALNLYYRSLGLSPKENWTFIDARTQQLNMQENMKADQQSEQQPLSEALQQQIVRAVQGGKVTLDDLLMAKMLRYKAQQWKIRMPGELDALVDDTTEEDLERAKSKKACIESEDES